MKTISHVIVSQYYETDKLISNIDKVKKKYETIKNVTLYTCYKLFPM